MTKIYCTHGATPVLLAEVLDRNAVVFAPTCRKGRHNLGHSAAPKGA
jgi:hypothetical protein